MFKFYTLTDILLMENMSKAIQNVQFRYMEHTSKSDQYCAYFVGRISISIIYPSIEISCIALVIDVLWNEWTDFGHLAIWKSTS